eukprot:g5103.t1
MSKTKLQERLSALIEAIKVSDREENVHAIQLDIGIATAELMYDVEMLLKKVSDVKMSTIVSDPRTNASFARIQKSDLLKRLSDRTDSLNDLKQYLDEAILEIETETRTSILN